MLFDGTLFGFSRGHQKGNNQKELPPLCRHFEMASELPAPAWLKARHLTRAGPLAATQQLERADWKYKFTGSARRVSAGRKRLEPDWQTDVSFWINRWIPLAKFIGFRTHELKTCICGLSPSIFRQADLSLGAGQGRGLNAHGAS